MPPPSGAACNWGDLACPQPGVPSHIENMCLSHAHWDHAINWNMFPKARIHIAETELDWAYDLPDGHHPLKV